MGSCLTSSLTFSSMYTHYSWCRILLTRCSFCLSSSKLTSDACTDTVALPPGSDLLWRAPRFVESKLWRHLTEHISSIFAPHVLFKASGSVNVWLITASFILKDTQCGDTDWKSNNALSHVGCGDFAIHAFRWMLPLEFPWVLRWAKAKLLVSGSLLDSNRRTRDLNNFILLNF